MKTKDWMERIEEVLWFLYVSILVFILFLMALAVVIETALWVLP